MLARLAFICIAVFWAVMNVLLWQQEFSKKGEMSVSVRPEKVWEKILTSPDSSALEIFHHGKKAGDCRWLAHAGQESAEKVLTEDFLPEDEPEQPASYVMQLEGTLGSEVSSNVVRFKFSVQLSSDQQWKELFLRLNMRPNSYEVTANVAEQKVRLVTEDETGSAEQAYTFAELEHPETLLREFGPVAASLGGFLRGAPQGGKEARVSLGVDWTARYDTIRFGHAHDRVYRLETKILNRFEIFIFVSRAGEILWVNLPDEWVLKHSSFAQF